MATLQQWNSSSDWYDKNMGENGDQLNHDLIFPVMDSELGDISGKVILDSGCGSGYFSTLLAIKAKKVIGTDFAEEFVKICKAKYNQIKNLSFEKHNVIETMPFASNSFDYVISKMVLQYVPAIDVFAKESQRVLVKGGTLIIAVDHPFNSQFYFAQATAGKPNPKYPGLKDYYDSSEQNKLSLWGKVKLTWYPKTVSNYINPFIENGLTLKNIIEIPEQKKEIKIPRILLLRFKK